MDFQDKFVQVYFLLVSVLQVFSRELLLEGLNIPKVFQMGELNPVTRFRAGPFESIDDRLYNSSYYVKSGIGTSRQKIVQPERMKTGNRKLSKWNEREEFEKENGDQLKWLTNQQFISDVIEQINNLNRQIKKLQMMSEIIKDLKAEVGQMKKSIPADAFGRFYKKTSSGDETGSKTKMDKEVNNVSHDNQYRIGNIYIINRLSEEKNSSFVDVEILKELTDHKIEELLEEAVNNSTEGRIPPVTAQSPHQEIDLLKQIQRSFSEMFNHQDVTLEDVEKMSKIVDFVERYHGTIGDMNATGEWGAAKNSINKSLKNKRYKNVGARMGKRGRRPG